MILSRINQSSLVKTTNVVSNIGFGRAKSKNIQDEFVPSHKLSSKDIQSIKKEMNKFPEDVQYRKRLLIDMGINPAEYYKLRSIVGIQEFETVVKELDGQNGKSYMPGLKVKGSEHILDSYGLENLKNGDFRANFHIHTNKSDGKSSVQEVLDSAVDYANQLKKTRNKPFYIAITDHNTVAGCKEAIEIIRKNPKKYENLRVILGSELSLKLEKIGEYSLKKPQNVHLLTMCVNPYDEKLSDFFAELVDANKTPMDANYMTLQDAMRTLSKQKYCAFSLAHPAWPYLQNTLKKPETYIDAMKKYISMFSSFAKDKALYTEVYYQSYDGEIAKDRNLLKTVERTTRNLGLLAAGGIDTHGKSIFYNK